MRRLIDLHSFPGVRATGFEKFSEPHSLGWKSVPGQGEWSLALDPHTPLEHHERLVLALLKHDWSGRVRVEHDKGAEVVDLFDPVPFHNYLVALPVGVSRVRLVPLGEKSPSAHSTEVWIRGAYVTDEDQHPNYFPKVLTNDDAENGPEKWAEFWSDGTQPGAGSGGWPYREPYMAAFQYAVEKSGSRSVMEIGAQSGRWLSYLTRYLEGDLSPLEVLRAYRTWQDGGFLALRQADRRPRRYEYQMVDCAAGAIRLATGRMPWVQGYHVPDFNEGLAGIPDKSTDVIFSFHTVEHIFRVERLLQDMARVARKYLICSTPMQENPHPLHPVRLDRERLTRFFVHEVGLDARQITFADDFSSENIRMVAPNSNFWCVRLEPGLPDPLERLQSISVVPQLLRHYAASSARVALSEARRRVHAAFFA